MMPFSVPSASAAGRTRPRLVRILLALHRWAQSGWAGSAVATWSLLQSAVLPGPSAALFAPLALADPTRAFRLARWAVAGSLAGALIAYGVGAVAAERATAFLGWAGVSDESLAGARSMFDRYGWLILVVGSFLPLLSTKVVSVAAGLVGYPVVIFALVILLVRAAQFMTLAAALRYAGAQLARRLARRFGSTGPRVAGPGALRVRRA
jgi:membrane protein YqaA with SNARE-associated domain